MSIQELLGQFGDKYIQALFMTWKLTLFSSVLAFVLGIYIPYYIHRAMHRYCENPLMKLLTFITGQQSFQTKTKA